tara:strand:+ start:104666 stop:105130 length:465 start_codon:yes stop_codon:yes gene_type:complete
MSPGYYIGLLVTDDDIDAVVLEGWPADVPKPRMVVFDYASIDVPDEYLLHVKTGTPNGGFTGREVFPIEYGRDCRYPSPAEILSVLDARKPPEKPSVLSIARGVHQSILELDARLDRLEQAPTGDDYNRLYELANGGLIDLLKALGEPSKPAAG